MGRGWSGVEVEEHCPYVQTLSPQPTGHLPSLRHLSNPECVRLSVDLGSQPVINGFITPSVILWVHSLIQ